MRVLIVYAHPEPASFNGALFRHAQAELARLGHQTEVSDLYAMGFDTRAGRHDFTTVANETAFHYQEEQAFAARHHGFVPALREEQEKLLRADAVIFQFPLWWFSVPAILKGWFDRVLAYGVAYGPPAGGTYKTGPLVGKRAMLSLTTGGPELGYGTGARNGDLNTILFPIQHGVLHFTGMEVLPPFVAWAPARATQPERQNMLALYSHRLRLMGRTPPLLSTR